MKWLLSDFHVHTAMSDGTVPILEVIDLFGANGVEVLNISDHLHDTVSDHGKMVRRLGKTIQDWDFYTKEIERARTYARDRYDMFVIQGAEITNYVEGFHIVAVDLKEPIDADLPAKDIINEIHRQGALAIAAHPYNKPDAGSRGYVFYLWDHLNEFRDIVDLWEIGNGRTLYEKVARENLRFVADSDFHHRPDFFSWKTLVHARKDVASIKKALLLQRVAIVKVRA